MSSCFSLHVEENVWILTTFPLKHFCINVHRVKLSHNVLCRKTNLDVTELMMALVFSSGGLGVAIRNCLPCDRSILIHSPVLTDFEIITLFYISCFCLKYELRMEEI